MTRVTDLTDESFVSLATFRRSGERVATPLWVVRDGDTAVFWTPRATGKVKRLRNNGDVELQPCGRRGAVAPDAPTALGHAEILDDEATLRRVVGLLRAKYGVQFRAVTLIEKVRPGMTDRVVIAVRDRTSAAAG